MQPASVQTSVRLLGNTDVVIERTDLPWGVQLRVENVDGVTEILELSLIPKENLDPFTVRDAIITKRKLARLPLGAMKSTAIAARSFDLRAVAASVRKMKPTQRPDGGWPVSHFREVADAYRRANLSEGKPRVAIATRWAVSLHTASKWIEKARELGFLDYPAKRGVAGTGNPRSPVTGKAKR